MDRLMIETDLGETQYRQWVRTGIVAIAIAYALVLLADLALGGPPRTLSHAASLLFETAVIVGAAAGYAILERGHVRRAALLVLAMLWTELHTGGLLAGHLMTAGAPALPVVVVASGLFLGGSGAVMVAAITAISFPLVVHLGSAAFDTGPGLTGADAFPAIIIVLTLLATGWVVRAGLTSYRTVLAAATDSACRIASLVTNSPYGILRLDASGTIASANPAAGEVLGASPAELQGRSLPTMLGLTLPPFALGFTAEVVFPRADGPRQLEIVAIPGNDDRSIQIAMRDLTRSRAMEMRAAQLGRMLDEAPSEVYVVDATTLRLRFVNRGARRNLGYGEGEIADLTASDVNPGLTRSRLSEFFREVRRDPSAADTRSRGVHLRRNGTVYPIEMQFSTGRFDDADVLIVLALDVSARVAAERDHEDLQHQLQHARRLEAVGQLAAGVAHEVNNVLLTIGTHLRLLDEDTTPAAVRAEVRAARAAQARGEVITRRLSAFAQRGVLQARRFSAADLLEEIRPLLDGMLGARHTLVVESEGAADMHADPSQCEQVLIQLIMNAREAMPDGGTVRLVLGAQDDHREGLVSVDVRDTGIGMDDLTQGRIFEPFFTTKAGGGGSGLGLTMVEALVARNGGAVEVRSRPGWGTRVRVRLPAAPADASSPVETAVPGGCVMLVEDDAGTRQALARLLQRSGYDVIPAGSVAEATAAAGGAAIDLLITDLALPDGSGVVLATTLRSTAPALPVLLITGHLEPEVPLDGFHPTRDLLIKPFPGTLLLRRVSEVLRAEPLAVHSG